MGNTPQRKDYFLPASILIAGILISGSIIYVIGRNQTGNTGGRPPDDQSAALNPKAETVEVSKRDVVLGDSDAPVSFIEYGDFQCPFCGRLHETVSPFLRKEYIETGKVKMVYRNFAFLGPESFDAAEAAECAKDQGRFWAFHDVLFETEIADGREHNGNLNRDLFIQLAEEAGMNTQEFTKCYDSEKYADQVKKDSSAARQAGVNSTPTTFINGQLVRGALPYESFKTIIDQALEAN